jgi:glycosyltransferase 2 family protein
VLISFQRIRYALRSLRPRTTRLSVYVFSSALTLILVYLALRDVDLHAVENALVESSYWWCIPSLVSLALAVFIRAVRWQLLFSRETRPPLLPVTSALLIGTMINNLLPARAGELARIIVLKERAGTARAEAGATVALERVYDLLSLLLVFFVVYPWLPSLTWLRAAVFLALAVTASLVVVVVTLALYGDRPLRHLARRLARFSFLPAERLDAAAANLGNGLRGARSLQVAIVALALGFLSWLVVGLSFSFLMIGFGLGNAILAGLLVTVAVNLAGILPTLPAGFGIFEAATIAALAAYGVPTADALSYALVAHALHFLPYVLVGVIAMHWRTLSVLNVRRLIGRETA